MIERERLGKINFLAAKRDEVGLRFARGFVVNSVKRFETGVGNLLGVVRNLDFRNDFSVFFHGGEFINPAERRHVFARDEFGSDAPTVYLRALKFKALHEFFVQIARGADYRVRITGFVEHFSRSFRKIGEIARVYSYSERLFALRFEFVENLYRVRDSAF